MCALFFMLSRAMYALNRKVIIYGGKHLYMYLSVCVLASGRGMCYIRLKVIETSMAVIGLRRGAS